MEVNKVSEEALKKALETLGLSKANDATENKDAELKKAQEDKAKLESELAETLKKAEEIKEKISGKKKEDKKDKEEDPKTDTKKEEGAEMSKAIIDNLSKSFEEKISSLGVIIAKQREENEILQKSVNGVSEFNNKLALKLGMIEKGLDQPVERRSITATNFKDRFDTTDLNKGGNANLKTLSLSNAKEREELANILFKAATEGKEKPDSELSKAVEYVELKTLGGNQSEIDRMSARIRKDFSIIVTK